MAIISTVIMNGERILGKENQENLINNADGQYLNLLRDILENGTESTDRTGTGTLKVFGRQLKFDLSEGFPLLTTKKVWFKGVKEELLWMISGEQNIRPLVLKDVHIWDEWPYQKYLEKTGMADKLPKYTPEWKEKQNEFIEKIKTDKKFAQKHGNLGPVYGYQWRHWKARDGKEIDQLANAVDTIKKNPDSRRIAVTAWDPQDLGNVALPPCHLYFQFQVNGEKLNTFMVQRSVDSFLGLPFNIASYALLTGLIARMTGKVPGELTMALADTHIYLNHLDQVRLQLTREPRHLPRLILDDWYNSFEEITSGRIRVEGYDPHPAIEAPISV